jgi:hypothetical protein
MPILPLLKIAGFDAAKTLASTFNVAWDVLQRSGCALATDDNDSVAGGVLAERAKGGRKMSNERASDLARQCTVLVRKGNDFPTVWSILLKSHALVDGVPRQRLERDRSLLDIRLVTGEQLVFDADVKEFRVQ